MTNLTPIADETSIPLTIELLGGSSVVVSRILFLALAAGCGGETARSTDAGTSRDATSSQQGDASLAPNGEAGDAECDAPPYGCMKWTPLFGPQRASVKVEPALFSSDVSYKQ
jgi:hypothetical protein